MVHRIAPDFSATPRFRGQNGGRVGAVLAAALLSLVGLGFTAQAGLASLERVAEFSPAPRDRALEPPQTSAAIGLATGAPGMTGTAALPAEPADYVPTVDPSLIAAPPFRFQGSALDRARATECLTTAIYYEAASEPDAGQAAVAQVILNRVRHPTFPNTVCGVIYQGSDRRGCQFSYACDGSMARAPSLSAMSRARRVAERALAGHVFAGVGMATHYHTYAVTPYWNKSLVMTGAYGAHFFHRWKGYWGTPNAFTAVYRGGEPPSGPMAAPVEAAITSAAASASLTVEQPRSEAPATRTASGETASADSQLPESTILDKWKDSGRPLP